MLGYVIAEGRGVADRLLAETAQTLRARGRIVAGVIQINRENARAGRCDMDLAVLGHDHVLRISQNLGPHARGCRLDPTGLEQAVGLVERALEARPQLLIVNKFGKTEIEGRGFRRAIGHALAEGIPVLTAVNTANRDRFLTFSEGLAESVAPQAGAILDWCERACAVAQA